MRRPLGSSGAWLVAAALAACGGGGSDPRAVATIELSATTLSVAAGNDAPLTAHLRDADGHELTGRTIVWSSRDAAIATVTQGSALTTVVRGVAPGTTQIAANSEGQSAVATVTVAPRAVASITVQPSRVDLRVTGTAQLQARTLDATGAELTGRPVTFASSDTAVATVSATGLVVAKAAGGATITVASEQRTALVAVTVTSIPTATVTVTPASPSIVVGGSVQMAAAALDSLGRTLTGRAATWASSDDRIATTSSSGLVIGVSPGTARITATIEGKSASQTVTVTAPVVATVALSATRTQIPAGEGEQLAVRLTDAAGNLLAGRVVSYASDAPDVATVNGTGLVTAVAPGTATITATSEGKSGTLAIRVVPVAVARVDVTPATSNLVIGGRVTLVATPRSASGAALTGRTVTWTSGAPGVVTVANDGTVSAIGQGTAVVFAQVEGVIGQATVVVTQVTVNRVVVTPATASVKVGASVDLTAAALDAAGATIVGRPVTWTSSDQTIAVVSSSGRVTGVRAGTVSIRAAADGVTGQAAVTVTP